MEIKIALEKRDLKIGATLISFLLLISVASGTINIRDSGPFNLFTTLDLNGNSIEGIGSLNNCGTNELIDGYGNCVEQSSIGGGSTDYSAVLNVSGDQMEGNLNMNSNPIKDITSANADIESRNYRFENSLTIKGANVTAVEHISNYGSFWAPFTMPDSDGVFFTEPTGPNDNEVDFRMHIEDDGQSTERFSIWGASCNNVDCWNVKSSTEFFRFDATGTFNIFQGNIKMNGNQIEGLSDPNDPQDAATKSYVDNNAGGRSLDWSNAYYTNGGDGVSCGSNEVLVRVEGPPDQSGCDSSEPDVSQDINTVDYSSVGGGCHLTVYAMCVPYN